MLVGCYLQRATARKLRAGNISKRVFGKLRCWRRCGKRQSGRGCVTIGIYPKINSSDNQQVTIRLCFFYNGLKKTEKFGTMGKRYGHIIEKIADMDNLRAADADAQKGKKNRHIRRHNLRQEEELQELRRMILDLDLPDAQMTTVTMRADSGKVREIVKQPFYPYRILHHAIMRVIAPIIYPNLIYDTFSCVPKKGLHFGVRRMKMMLRRYPEYGWFWKTDYKKFYQSIPHEVVIASLERKFKDKRFIELMRILIGQYESGGDIKQQLKDEQLRKARNEHRRVHKPTAGQLCIEYNRPLHERAATGEVLPAELRRHGRVGADEIGSSATVGGVRKVVGRAGAGSQGIGVLRSYKV